MNRSVFAVAVIVVAAGLGSVEAQACSGGMCAAPAAAGQPAQSMPGMSMPEQAMPGMPMQGGTAMMGCSCCQKMAMMQPPATPGEGQKPTP